MADTLDLLVGCLGYEARSSYVPLQLAARASSRIASAFDSQQVLSFDSNRTALEAAEFAIEVHAEGEIRNWLAKELLGATGPGTQAVRVAVDVSSFSRVRLSEILLALCDAAAQRQLQVDLVYAPARYQPPSESDETITVARPVAYEFAGWPTSPESPLVGVIGLGYEPGRAVGTAEYLDADHLWGFVPTGVDSAFDQSVESANALFWVDPRTRQARYEVLSPFATFSKLESLVYGLGASHRVVIVPFGPKIFATCALLVGLLHPSVVSIWRVSAGVPDVPVEQTAAGVMTSLRLGLGPVRPKPLIDPGQ
jgi:hypothetical protein